MRKVFLDELPKKMRAGKEIIDWKNSVGHRVPFVYDDKEGMIEIVKYTSSDKLLILKYNNNILWNNPIGTYNFSQCKIGYCIGVKTKEFKYSVGETIKDENRNLTIISKRNNGTKEYKYKCNKCGFDCGEHYKKGEFRKELWVKEGDIVKGNGCSCCHSIVVASKINSIWAKTPWMIDLGINAEDSKKYTPQSNLSIKVICPDCKKNKDVFISSVYSNKSIGCSCGDGFSYPEKFISNILTQLGIDYKIQTSKNIFEWCGKYRYDFYLPDYNMIIETHGLQHYEGNTNFKMSLKEVQENDRIKKELALNNGIEYYIELDCRYSDLDYIKHSVLNSKLSKLLNLTNVDWVKSDVYSLKNNKVKDVCDYWNNKQELETVSDLASIFNKDRTTIRNYLKKGTKLGWCDYNAEKEKENDKKRKSKPVAVLKENENLGVYPSAIEIEKISEEMFGVKLLRSEISGFLRGRYNSTYKGFTFKYVEK